VYNIIISHTKITIKLKAIRNRRYRDTKYVSTAVFGVTSQQAAIVTALLILKIVNTQLQFDCIIYNYTLTVYRRVLLMLIIPAFYETQIFTTMSTRAHFWSLLRPEDPVSILIS
jgi:hypothetical protein